MTDVRTALTEEAVALEDRRWRLNDRMRRLRDLIAVVDRRQSAVAAALRAYDAPATPSPMRPAPVFVLPRRPVRWTAARIEVLRRDYPTYRLTDAIVDDVNALPGDRLSKHDVVAYATKDLGLRRPPDYVVQARVATVTAAADPALDRWCTPGREEILRKMFPTPGTTMPAIRAALETLPGPLPNNVSISAYARSALRLQRQSLVTSNASDTTSDAKIAAEPSVGDAAEALPDLEAPPSTEPAAVPEVSGTPVAEPKTGSALPEGPALDPARTAAAAPGHRGWTIGGRERADVTTPEERPRRARVVAEISGDRPRALPGRPAADAGLPSAEKPVRKGEKLTRASALAAVSAALGRSAVTRDGMVSVVALAEKDATETVEWSAVVDWATENRESVPIAGCRTKGDLMRAVNAARRAAGLSPWVGLTPDGRTVTGVRTTSG